MRIVELIPSLHVGGAERIVALMATALAAEGHQVSVVSLGGPSGSWIEAELRAASIETIFLGKRPGLDLRAIPRLGRALARLRPEVLHTHLHVLKYALPARLAWRRCTVVHTLHNLAEREAVASDRRLQQLAFRGGVAPVSIGDAVAESLERVYRIPARYTIPNGIPVAAFRSPPGVRAEVRAELSLPGEAACFLAVGRLNPQKNHAALLAAFADPRLAGCRLLIAGDGELRGALEQQAGALGVADRVHFLGVRKDVPRLLAAADGLVMASSWEGNPLVVMEAMSAGLPVVATAVGCVPELVSERTGWLVPAGDEGALAEALAALAGDLGDARGRGEAGAKVALERFDVSVMARAYVALFEELRRGRS